MKIPIISGFIETFMASISIYWDLPQMLIDALGNTSEENAVIIIALLLIMILALYLVTFIIIYLVIIDNIFPYMEIRDSLKNRIKVARILYATKDKKISRLKKADTLHIKTPGFFPIFETLPVYIGGDKDNDYRFRWFRIYTIQNKELKNIVWQDNEHKFILQYEPLTIDKETLDEYLKDARKELKAVSHGVTQGIKGDYGLQKEKYTLQAVPYHLYEDDEKKEENEKKKTTPKTEPYIRTLEKEEPWKNLDKPQEKTLINIHINEYKQMTPNEKQKLHHENRVNITHGENQ